MTISAKSLSFARVGFQVATDSSTELNSLSETVDPFLFLYYR